MIRLPLTDLQRLGFRFLPFILLTLASCAKEYRAVPETFPASGTIDPAGRTLPVGGTIEFEPITRGVEFTANGVIDKDGGFSLKIPYVDRVLPGATAGPHHVRVLLPLEQQGKSSGVVRIDGEFEIKAGENRFTISFPSS